MLINNRFKEFFKVVVEYMHVRTTDVHVSCVLPFVDEMVSAFPGVSKDLITVALILHDIGWSQMTEEEVAASLGVSGLQLTPSALGPKEKHATLGAELALKLINEHKDLLPSFSSNVLVHTVLFSTVYAG